MIGGTTSLANALVDERANDDSSAGFATILHRYGSADDAQLADLIERDGRHCIMRGQPVSLERYLGDVPDLFDRQLPLDAAIDVTLRSMSRSASADVESVDELVNRYPKLEQLIREAAALSNAMWPSTQIHSNMTECAQRSLPAEFGPIMPDGRPRYILKRLLGSGAFGQVYEGVDRQFCEDDYEAIVAVKILASQGRTAVSRHRLIAEASKARRVDHANVVRVIDRGVSADNEDFIVYELVDGGDLSQWIRVRAQPIEPHDAARLMAQIARGVQAAHTAGLVHCDLKPGNIMLTKDGRPKVADFGIAIRAGESFAELRTGEERRPIGNLAFISPEQYRMEDHAATPPSDIYALGGILYLLLTGELPNGASIEEIDRVHDCTTGRARAPSPRDLRPDIDRDLDAICRRALAVNPHDRHRSAESLADDLEAWLRHEPIYWTRPSAFRKVWLSLKRQPTAAIAMLFAIAAIVGSIEFNLPHRRATIVEQQAMAALHTADMSKELKESVHSRSDDRMQYVRAIESSAVILNQAHIVKNTPNAFCDATERELRQHAIALQRMHQRMRGGSNRASPLHLLVVRSLATVYGPSLLDDPYLRQAYLERAVELSKRSNE